MANTLLTIDQITREALRLAHEKAAFIGTVNRQFDDSFGRTDGKIGDTLRIRYPSEYSRRTGSRVMDVQDSVQVSTSLVVATQDGVDMRFNSREMALDLQSFSELHLAPAMATLISGIESDFLTAMTKATYNFAGNNATGTAQTTVSSLTAAGNARTRMNQALAPKGDRYIQMDSATMANMVTGVAGYFNPSNAISEQYREGLVARTAMADYYENERVYTDQTTTSVTFSTAKANGYVSTLGQTSTNITTNTYTFNIGNVFTMGSVFDVHPETKASYGVLKQFTVTATTNASTISFQPPIYRSGPRQNVTGVGTTTSTNAIAFLGVANSSCIIPLMYHKDAFTFATAELPLMGGADKCVRRTYDGLSLRVWQDADIRNDELLTRIDILYGYAAIRPQWACRIVGAYT